MLLEMQERLLAMMAGQQQAAAHLLDARMPLSASSPMGHHHTSPAAHLEAEGGQSFAFRSSPPAPPASRPPPPPPPPLPPPAPTARSAAARAPVMDAHALIVAQIQGKDFKFKNHVRRDSLVAQQAIQQQQMHKMQMQVQQLQMIVEGAPHTTTAAYHHHPGTQDAGALTPHGKQQQLCQGAAGGRVLSCTHTPWEGRGAGVSKAMRPMQLAASCQAYGRSCGCPLADPTSCLPSRLPKEGNNTANNPWHMCGANLHGPI